MKSAGVGENRFGPRDPFMQAAGFFNEFGTGTKGEVVGVAENNLGVYIMKVLGGEGFDRALGADGHEDGGFDGAMGSVQNTRSGFGCFRFFDEFEVRHAQDFFIVRVILQRVVC